MKWDVNPRGEVADHFCAVERDDSGFAVREVVGQETAAGTEGVAGPGDVDVDLLDANFEDIAGFGFFDGDRAGENVATGAFFSGRIIFVDVAHVSGNVGFGYAEGLEALGCSACGEGLDLDGVARFDGEGRLCLRGVKAPGDCGGRREEGLCGLLGACSMDGKKCSDAKGYCVGELGGHGFYISQ